MKKDEFLKFFCSENIVGTIHMFMKKLLVGIKQVTVDFNYMPIDFLYPIIDNNYKDPVKDNDLSFGFGNSPQVDSQ